MSRLWLVTVWVLCACGLATAQDKGKKLDDFFQANAKWQGELVFTLPKKRTPIKAEFTVTDRSGNVFRGVQKNDDGFQAELRGTLKKDGSFTWEYDKFIPTEQFPNEPTNLRKIQATSKLAKGKLRIDFKWPMPKPSDNVGGYFTFEIDE